MEYVLLILQEKLIFSPESRKSHGSTAVSRRKVSYMYASLRKAQKFYKKIALEEILMHVNEVICLEQNGETTWELYIVAV